MYVHIYIYNSFICDPTVTVLFTTMKYRVHFHAIYITVHTAMCRFMCSARWSEREKARSHSRHWNGLSPVCLR